MKHTPQIALTAARTELDAARDACPHWDLQSESECEGGRDECCYRVDDAKRALRKARLAVAHPGL